MVRCGHCGVEPCDYHLLRKVILSNDIDHVKKYIKENYNHNYPRLISKILRKKMIHKKKSKQFITEMLCCMLSSCKTYSKYNSIDKSTLNIYLRTVTIPFSEIKFFLGVSNLEACLKYQNYALVSVLESCYGQSCSKAIQKRISYDNNAKKELKKCLDTMPLVILNIISNYI